MGKDNSRRRYAIRNSVRHAPLALSLPLFFAAAFPAVGMAACVSWNVAGAWTFVHDDNSIRKLRLEHAKSRITGSTTYSKNGNYRSPNMEGLIDGTLVGNRLEMTILWKSGVMSMYEATISRNGSLQGISYDKRDPGRQIHWLADRQASCTALQDRVPNRRASTLLDRREFGDPTLGSQGSTVLGPGSLHIRASLEAAAQSGFDQSANFHFSRRYRP